MWPSSAATACLEEKHLRAAQADAVGYGTRLPLNLVYNPLGPQLPGPQAELEADYKESLRARIGIVFNRLFTITNQPIAPPSSRISPQGKIDEYSRPGQQFQSGNRWKD